MSIKCIKGQWTAAPLFFRYQLSDGTTYTADNGNAATAASNEMDCQTLSSGESTSGLVVFDVRTAGGKLNVEG